jgi:hypothetical protein
MKLKIAVIGLAALCGVALGAGSAVAMPNGLPRADQIAGQAANVEQVRWVCNAWGRCFWRRPAFYGAYAWGGPRSFWGWRRGWW